MADERKGPALPLRAYKLPLPEISALDALDWQLLLEIVRAHNGPLRDDVFLRVAQLRMKLAAVVAGYGQLSKVGGSEDSRAD